MEAHRPDEVWCPTAPSGRAGSVGVRLDAVVAEHAAQAVKLAAQFLVLRGKSLLGIRRFAIGVADRVVGGQVSEESLEVAPVALLEARVGGGHAEEPTSGVGEDDRRGDRGEEDEAQGGGVDVGGQFALALAVSGGGEVLGRCGAVGWRVLGRGETSPHEQAQGTGIGEGVVEVAGN